MENWLNNVLLARTKKECKDALLTIDQSLNADDIANVLETAINQLNAEDLQQNIQGLLFKSYLVRQSEEKKSHNNDPANALFFIADMLFNMLAQRKACQELRISHDELNQAHIEWRDLPQQQDCLYERYRRQHLNVERRIISRFNAYLDDVMSAHYVGLLKTLEDRLEQVGNIIYEKIQWVEDRRKTVLLTSALKAKDELYDIVIFNLDIVANGKNITATDMECLFTDANRIMQDQILRPLRRYELDRGFLHKIKTWLVDTLKMLTHKHEFSTKKTVATSYTSLARLFHHSHHKSRHITNTYEIKKISY